jgi:cytochrome P450
VALPPGPRSPEALQTLEWVARPTTFLRACAERYGDPFTIRTAWTAGPVVVTSDHDTARSLFTEHRAIARGGSSSAVLEPFAGPQSILLLDGPEHARQRRLILPPLHGDRMRALAPLVAELAEAELRSWPRGRPVRTLGRMRALTLEVVLRLVFGAQHRAEVEPLRAAIARTLDLTTSLPRLVALSLYHGRVGPWASFHRAVAALDEQVLRVIDRHRHRPDDGSILGLLLAARHEDGTPPQDAELRDQLVTLLAAGHETTATALAWAFERLSRRPEVLTRLRDGDDAYLDATVREVLRTRPVLTIVPRRLTAPLTGGGHDLPAGTHVAPCPYLMHRRPELFADPLAFRPERWIDGPAPPPYAFLPFGGGDRRCPGAAFASMEMAEVLRVAARHTLAPSGPRPERARRRSVTVSPARGGAVVVG